MTSPALWLFLYAMANNLLFRDILLFFLIDMDMANRKNE